MNNKILLIGKMGSGKDYFADWLVEEKGFTMLRLSQSLKEYFEIAYGRPADKSLPEDRKALQDIGKAMREYDKDYWCNIVKRKSLGLDKVVVPDCRFINEGEYFSDFLKVKIVTEDNSRFDALKKRDGVVHKELMLDASEMDLDNIVPDIEIFNTYQGIPQKFINLFN